MYVVPLHGFGYLNSIIWHDAVNYHHYADDTQLYIGFSTGDCAVQLETLKRCIASVHEWLLHNGLSLNPSKLGVIQYISTMNALTVTRRLSSIHSIK